MSFPTLSFEFCRIKVLTCENKRKTALGCSRNADAIRILEVPPRFELGNEGFADLYKKGW